MDLLKKELYNQHQKIIKNLTWKHGLMNTPAVLAFLAFVLYVKPEDGDIRMLVALCLYVLYTVIVGTPYLMKVRKLNKEHEQQIAELDAKDR